MKLAPQDAELHRNLGVLYLLQGRFEEGWNEYRWRWRCPEMPRPKLPAPLWQGESVEGKRILLYAEQGLGDTFHFLRYAGVLKKRGAKVILHGLPPHGFSVATSRYRYLDSAIVERRRSVRLPLLVDRCCRHFEDRPHQHPK